MFKSNRVVCKPIKNMADPHYNFDAVMARINERERQRVRHQVNSQSQIAPLDPDEPCGYDPYNHTPRFFFQAREPRNEREARALL